MLQSLCAAELYSTGFEAPEFKLGSLGTGAGLATQSSRWSLYALEIGVDLPGLVKVQSATVKSGGQALMVQSSAAKSIISGFSTQLENTAKSVVFQANVRLGSSANLSRWQFAVGDPSAEGGYVGGVNIAAEDGSLEFISKGGGKTGPLIARDAWHRLVLDFDISKQTYRVLVNGTAVASDIAFQAAANKLRIFQFATAGNGNDVGYFDNFLIGDGPFVPEQLPEIAVRQPIGSDLTDNKSKNTFGRVKVGSGGKAKTFTIKNTGNAKLSGLAINKNGPNAAEFKVSGPGVTSLAPGKQTTFKVTFKPTKKGTRKAAIHIKSNDKDENPFDINLAGEGVSK